eukprot:CAMPEP_0168394814 /NCGR_PEP_ID=MMETSP0228-20121227/19727_1 /TAXON_ID=133427 /ORGANISM="Protoceratium reticulatum, Strain CCCM 535 (=CCMP 1889)" /LENGTH=88 /DNA_ID=CAMNT_0008408237 /DNA_START=130 /DNA_END=396 /DNA_ORIENTATION=-
MTDAQPLKVSVPSNVTLAAPSRFFARRAALLAQALGRCEASEWSSTPRMPPILSASTPRCEALNHSQLAAPSCSSSCDQPTCSTLGPT